MNELGKEQAEKMKEQLKDMKSEPEKVIILSPMERTRETAFPTLKDRYTTEGIAEIRKNYERFQKTFREMREKKEVIDYLQDTSKQQLFDLSHGVWGDFRASEYQQPSIQSQNWSCKVF